MSTLITSPRGYKKTAIMLCYAEKKDTLFTLSCASPHKSTPLDVDWRFASPARLAHLVYAAHPAVEFRHTV